MRHVYKYFLPRSFVIASHYLEYISWEAYSHSRSVMERASPLWRLHYLDIQEITWTLYYYRRSHGDAAGDANFLVPFAKQLFMFMHGYVIMLLKALDIISPSYPCFNVSSVKPKLKLGYGLVITSHIMMTSSNGNIFWVTDPLRGEFTVTGEFPSQRTVTRSFDVFFDLHLNRRLSKQSRRQWFEAPSRLLWRHCNAKQYECNANVYPCLDIS